MSREWPQRGDLPYRCSAASTVAGELWDFLAGQGVSLPPSLAHGSDPLQVLRWVGEHSPGLVRATEDLLTMAETRAVEVATPTKYAADVIAAAPSGGRRVAIVSNNSEAAIARYLALHNLTASISLVAGRAYGEPALMKPHPDVVVRALQGLGRPPDACVLVGDSPADMMAARTAGVRAVGYAKAEDRIAGLVDAHAAIVIRNLRDLAQALSAQ